MLISKAIQRAIFGILVFAGVSYASPPATKLYQGALEIDSLKSSQGARLALLPYLRPSEVGDGTVAYVATLTLGFDRESVPLYFSNVRFNPQIQELLLLPDAITDGKGKLPTLSLRYTTEKNLEGTYVSPISGLVGKLKLTATNEFKAPTNVLKPLEGVYRANCPTSISGDTRLTGLQIIASRLDFTTGGLPSEAAIGGVNYIGSALCDFGSSSVLAGDMTCAGFHNGVYSPYSGDVILTDDTNSPWQCRRDLTGDKVTCQGKWFKGCTLTRGPKEAERKVDVERTETIAPQNAAPSDTGNRGACGAWDGTYRGVLRHALTGKEQFVSVRLATHLLNGPLPPVKCSIQGSASLIFGLNPDTDERIGSVIPEFEFIPNRPEQVLLPEKEGDSILQIGQPSAGLLEGNWYSKRFGYVGKFTASADSGGTKTLNNPLYGLTADYEETDPTRGYLLSLSVIPAVNEIKSPNPYNALSVLGWHDVRVVRLPIKAAAYDYFANRLILDTGGVFLVGDLDKQGFHYSMVARKFQTIPTVGEIYLHARK